MVLRWSDAVSVRGASPDHGVGAMSGVWQWLGDVFVWAAVTLAFVSMAVFTALSIRDRAWPYALIFGAPLLMACGALIKVMT